MRFLKLADWEAINLDLVTKIERDAGTIIRFWILNSDVFEYIQYDSKEERDAAFDKLCNVNSVVKKGPREAPGLSK